MKHHVRVMGLIVLSLALLGAYLVLTVLADDAYEGSQQYIAGMLTVVLPGTFDALSAQKRLVDVEPALKPRVEESAREIERESDHG